MASTKAPIVGSVLSKTRSAFAGIGILSAVTNLLMLAGPLYMMQVYDRVLASGSVPTLIALSGLIVGIYLFLGVLEIIRSRILLRIGAKIDEDLSEAVFAAVLALPLRARKSDASSLPVRDLDQIRQFMAGPGPVAICDLPWLPVYLAILFAFHSYLGWLAVAGATILVAITLFNEWVLRAPTARLSELSAQRGEMVEAGRRHADTIRAMGMAGHYTTRWNGINAEYQKEQGRSGDLGGGVSASTKIFRLALQSAVLGLGAWLAILQELSPGAMIAASIITSRALAPIEQAIGQWRGFIAARQSRWRLQAVLERLRDDRPVMTLAAPSQAMSVNQLAVAEPEGQTVLIRGVGSIIAATVRAAIQDPAAFRTGRDLAAWIGITPSAHSSGGKERLGGFTKRPAVSSDAMRASSQADCRAAAGAWRRPRALQTAALLPESPRRLAYVYDIPLTGPLGRGARRRLERSLPRVDGHKGHLEKAGNVNVGRKVLETGETGINQRVQLGTAPCVSHYYRSCGHKWKQ